VQRIFFKKGWDHAEGHMKKLLWSTIACAAIFASAPVIAADVPVAPQPATPFGPNWTGFYFGAAFGGGWTHLDESIVSVSRSNTSFFQEPGPNVSSSTTSYNSVSSGSGNKSGAFADLMIGYSLLVSPSWVAGVQVEGTLSDMIFHAEGTFNSSSSTLSGPVTTDTITINSAEFAVKMHWTTAAIVRLGWLVTPSTLLYGTGGATYAGFGDGLNFDTFRAWGWSAGAGVEQKFGSNWSVRVEYRFTDFQASIATTATATTSAGSTPSTPFSPGSSETTTSVGQNAIRYEPQMHTVRLGIIYTFN
jgi:outer membrane immunogenic protein